MIVLVVTLVIGFAIFLAGAIAFVMGLPDSYGKHSSVSQIVGGVLISIFGVLVFIAGFGWTEIGPGQVGVIVNLGKVDSSEISSGLNWRFPIVSSIHVMDTRVQSFQFGGDPQGDTNKPENSGIETFTAEQQPAYMYGNVNYSIDPTYAAELYQTVGDDWFNKVVANPALTEIKQDARSYTVDQITSARDALAKAALTRLQTDVAPYHITINGIFINNIRLSPAYTDAVLQKQIAQQNVEKAKAEAETARQQAQGQADARVTQAKGEAQATVELANGQAQANAAISASINENLIRWQQVQKLNPNVQTIIVPADSNFIINGVEASK